MTFYSAQYDTKEKSPFRSGQSNGSTRLMSGTDKMLSARQWSLQNCCSPQTRPHGATTEEISICVVICMK